MMTNYPNIPKNFIDIKKNERQIKPLSSTIPVHTIANLPFECYEKKRTFSLLE